MSLPYIDDHLVPSIRSKTGSHNFGNLRDGLNIPNNGIFNATLECVAFNVKNDSSVYPLCIVVASEGPRKLVLPATWLNYH